jgi:hypothetical protein
MNDDIIQKIIDMIHNGEYFKVIFETLKCSDKEFLKAMSIYYEMEFTTVIHNDPNYNGETVAY